ncbi:ATP-binding cassette domain-containing protein [Sphingorhabdus sp. Alg231-15]|uniref:ATP-binding cassette domain-containing protein n=1 Tax=Sphingorhabdus sp. Alg231-15 TaxID=1922222 RepID=UPI000D5565E2
MSSLPQLFNRTRGTILCQLVLNGFAQAVAIGGIGLALKSQFDAMQAAANSNLSILVSPAIIMAGLAMMIAILKWRERIDMERLGQDYVFETRMRIFSHINGMSAHGIEELRKGVVMLRFVNDLTALRQWISMGIASGIVALTIMIGALTFLTIINPMIGVAALAVMSVGAVAILLLGKRVDHTIREARRRRGNIAGNIAEKLSNMVMVQAFGQRRTERKKLRRQSKSLQKAMINRASATGLVRALSYLVASMTLVAAMGIGAYAIYNGVATTGEIVAAFGIVSLAAPALNGFGRLFEYWKNARVAREKIGSIFHKGPALAASTSRKALGRVRGELRFDNVSSGSVIKNFSASAKPGAVIAIKGHSGVGKTTLLRLAQRLIDPDKGAIYLDGRDIMSVRTGELRRTISLASSLMPLMRGTIWSNIAYGCSKASQSDIQDAARIAGIMINNPHAALHADRAVHEQGTNLSAGERARVILARALVSKPKILLLDEPEQNLDELGMAALRRIISTFSGTVVMVTHDPGFLAMADDIWALGAGHQPALSLIHNKSGQHLTGFDQRNAN